MSLRAYRRSYARMTGHEAARWLGVAPAVYWRWERGQVPSPQNLKAIYRFSGGRVTPNGLLGIAGEGV